MNRGKPKFSLRNLPSYGYLPKTLYAERVSPFRIRVSQPDFTREIRMTSGMLRRARMIFARCRRLETCKVKCMVV
jgi:hypothetical protein